MLRSKSCLLTLAVVAAALPFCAACASSASASWLVGGSALSGSAALATKAATAEPFKLKAAGVSVECSGSISNIGGEIQSPNKIAASSIIFSECTANENCLVTKSIGTVPVTAELTEQSSSEDIAAFKPKTKTTLATIKFEGEKCALLGTQPTTGKAAVKLPAGQSSPAQQVSANTTEASGELKLGSSAAELKGSALLELASGLSFGAGALGFEWSYTPSPSPEFTMTNQLGGVLIKAISGKETISKIEIKPETAFKFVKADKNGCARAYNPPPDDECNVEIKFVAVAKMPKVKYTERFKITYSTRDPFEFDLKGEV